MFPGPPTLSVATASRESYGQPMSVSRERFETIVRAVTADQSKIVKVEVYEFGFTLTLKARRYQYDVSAHYDPVRDHWTGYDPYRGSTIPWVMNQVDQRMRE